MPISPTLNEMAVATPSDTEGTKALAEAKKQCVPDHLLLSSKAMIQSRLLSIGLEKTAQCHSLTIKDRSGAGVLWVDRGRSFPGQGTPRTWPPFSPLFDNEHEIHLALDKATCFFLSFLVEASHLSKG